MRRRARVRTSSKSSSVADALRAIRFAEIVVLLLDATIPFEKQDLQIADLVAGEGRALVIAVNKWDLVEDPAGSCADLQRGLERLLPQVTGVAVVAVSGLTGRGLDKLMEAVIETARIWNRRISTAKLNRWLEEQWTGIRRRRRAAAA